MSRLSQLTDEGKRHHLSLKNRDGKTLVKVPLLIAVIILIAAPQLLVIVLAGLLLEMIDVEYDGRSLIFGETDCC